MNIFTKIHKRLRVFFCIDKSEEHLGALKEIEKFLTELLKVDAEAFELYPLYSKFDYLGLEQRVVGHKTAWRAGRTPDDCAHNSKVVCSYVSGCGELCHSEIHVEDLIALYEGQNESKKDEDKMLTSKI